MLLLSLSSSSSILFFLRDEEVGWMDDGTDDGMDVTAVLSARERLALVAVIRTDDDGILGQMDGKDDHRRTD